MPSPVPAQALRQLSRSPRMFSLALLLASLLLSSGCNMLFEAPTTAPEAAPTSMAALPTPLPLASPVQSDKPTPLPLSLPTAEPTPEVEPTVAKSPIATDAPPPTPDPSAARDWDLLYVQDGTVYRGDYWGNDPRPVMNVGLASTLALHEQLLAYDDLSSLVIANMATGDVRRIETLPEDPTSNLHFLWASDGQALVYALSREDPQATRFGRSVDIGRVEKSGHQAVSLFTLSDYPGATLLKLDGPGQELVLVPQGEDPSFREAWLYDASTGVRKASLQVEGDGLGIPSPDGRRLLTTSFDSRADVSQIRIYDLTDGSGAGPAVYLHQPNTHSAGHVWSSDGSVVVFLLRAGKSRGDDASAGLGIWSLDTATMQTDQIAEETLVGSGPIGSTPDGEWVICYHLDPEGSSYYYALRPDGTDRSLLALAPQARLVGWAPSIPTSVETPTPQHTMAQVQDLFRRALLDQSLLPEGAAVLLTLPEIAPMDDGQATAYLNSTLAEAGWNTSEAAQNVTLTRMGDHLVLLKLPPDGIYLFWPGGWQRVVSGDLIQDARLVDDELGLIFAQIRAGAANPAFLLLRRHSAGGWDPLWSPAGQREWICTDGSITFSADGLSQLRLIGSSFGLDSGQDEVFSECHACPHRTLVGLWERRGDEYRRASGLPPDAPRAEQLWEITEPSPYASLYEFARRLRAGDQPGARLLAVNELTVQQALEHGLADKSVRLAATSTEANRVDFAAGESGRRLTAELEYQDGQWLVLSITETK